MNRPLFGVMLGTAISTALAAQLPEPAKNDLRIRYVNYSKDDVTVIQVQRGTVTRIVLGENERILKDGSATGFASDCSKANLEWCIHADPGTNQVMIKPKDGATHNNLELKTDLYDYSFAFHVLPDHGIDLARRPTGGGKAFATPMYRVIFRYPPQKPQFAATLLRTAGGDVSTEGDILNDRLEQARPAPKNWKYTSQASAGSEDIVPTLAFDDGRFTYLRFPANREIPTVFAISPQGEESRINFHMDENDDTLMVVERMSRRFVLRLGPSTVGLWNEAFDSFGDAPNGGTTVPGVTRALREGK